jgi:hypothetical protein
MKTTGDVRRRTLPVLVLALLLAGLPGVATAAPAVPNQGGVSVERVWEWVRGWVAGLTALISGEGSMIDPNGSKAPDTGQNGQGGQAGDLWAETAMNLP